MNAASDFDARPDFAAHRASLLERLDDDEAVLLFGAPHHLRNGDAEYRYRPSSDIYWLLGWEDPQVAVFLRPGEEPLTVFCQPRDPEREVWEGFRPGPDGVKEAIGADAAFPFAALEEQLPRLLQGVRRLHYAFAVNPDHDALLMASINVAARSARKNGLDFPETFYSPSHLLHELRLRKSEAELATMRRACAISVAGHLDAMKAAVPGAYEFEVEAALEGTFRRMGSTGPGYTSIVAGGANACVLHYITNRDRLNDGDLLLIDAGAEHCYYTADITRTFPVNGTFTEPQRKVYDAVLKAQVACIDAIRPGVRFSEVHDIAVRSLTESMVELGLLEGDVDELIAEESYKRWYMHGTGHWLGLDVHDVGAYGRDGATRELEPGMITTVEPGLYIPPDAEDAPEELRGIGVRIEDDVLVTDDGNEVLTEALPKDADAIEALLATR